MSDSLYNYKPLRTPIFGKTVWGITFEDCVIREFTGSFEDIRQIVLLLNAAWSLGYSSGYICGGLK